MIILGSLYLIFLFACLVVLIALFIKSVRDHKKFKKQWAELDKKPEVTCIEIGKLEGEQLEQYRIVKAQTVANGEKYFVEFYFSRTQKWITIVSVPYKTYKEAYRAMLYLEKEHRNDLKNQIKSKEVVG
uniref:hypothetical protein n=1 Tax=Lactococcus garvieae TaxID=1363 RepID=UPI00359C45C2